MEESRIRQVEEGCGLGAFGGFALRTLLLYEWDEEFSREVDRTQGLGPGHGISFDVLKDLWEHDHVIEEDIQKELDLIGACEELNGKRAGVYRLKSVLYRFLAEAEGRLEVDRTCVKVYDGEELLLAGEPDEKKYPQLLKLWNRLQWAGEGLYLMNLTGRKGSGRLENLQCFARERKAGLLLLSGRAFLELTAGEQTELFETLLLKYRLEPWELALSWDMDGESPELEQLLRRMARSWAGYSVLLGLITETPVKKPDWEFWNCQCTVFPMREPDRYGTLDLWHRQMAGFGLSGRGELDLFLQRYRFTPGQMKEVLQAARNLAWSRGREQVEKEDLLESCKRQVEYRFAGKAVRIEPRFSWEDLILAKDSLRLLKDICNQTVYWNKVYGEWDFGSRFAYGMGNSLLFAGSPGTGKTMAAQVMAGALEMDLFRVELSTVVSKYIGETEKNLNLIFDEAKKSLCILFFDEADVLFGKRTEVKDSQDKYSNMEAAFLLQKMEEYDGLSILATNFQQNIDEAFKRRMKYMIEFPMPTGPERRKMWKRAFPANAPVEETVDYDFLAEKFELTGSNIKNIAVNAAFMAAAENTAIGMEQLVRALKSEYQKSGKRLTREELEQYGTYG